jgi:hypothetical protein
MISDGTKLCRTYPLCGHKAAILTQSLKSWGLSVSVTAGMCKPCGPSANFDDPVIDQVLPPLRFAMLSKSMPSALEAKIIKIGEGPPCVARFQKDHEAGST